MFTLRIQHWRHGLAFFGIVLGVFYAQAAMARPWTTLEGKVVEAELVDIVHDGNAVVLDVSGKRFEVPLERLSQKDRGYVQGLKDANFKPSDAEINREIDEAVSEDEQGKGADRNQPVRLGAERIWRSREGAAVEAKFLRMVYGTVVLKEGPRYHRIQYYDLSLADRQFLFDAHKAINKEAMVPPVRPDLKDAVTSVPAYDNQPPGPTSTIPMPPPSNSSNGNPSGGNVAGNNSSGSTRPSSSNVVLPGNGFGAGSAETKLPPSGFGSTPRSTNLPSNGFGSTSPDSSDSSVKLPPSGFGSASPGSNPPNVKLPSNGFGNINPEPTPSTETPFDSDEKLPGNGFGNMQEEPIVEEKGSFDSIPSSSGFGSKGHVTVPSSTIVENSPESNSEDQPPLFDVASLEPSSGGFGGSNSPPRSQPGTTRPSTSPNSTPTKPNQPPQPTTQPQNNPTSAITNPNDSQYQPQTYTPQSDFNAYQPPAQREYTTTDWNLQMFGVTLLGTGSMMIAGGYFWIVALAFLEDHHSGVRSLIPGMAIVYGLSEWEKSSTALYAMMLGVCLILGGFGLLMSVS
ncbi:hypothetical protein GC197_00500 [bacterium]|nr:hypothetical protein [bacterium]